MNHRVDLSAGEEMHALMTQLFPLCRSITGEGTRQTLEEIKKLIPITISEVESGTKCLDWTIPDEWNVRDAYIKDNSGRRVLDFKSNNLHLVGYSIPHSGVYTLEQLKSHLHTLPKQPTAIPYVTSYYSPYWGFCMSHKQFKTLKNQNYEVHIDTTLTKGVLRYADLIVHGNSDKEILISANICHPSMANNELSGPILATYLARWLLTQQSRHYTYRFVFVPETIGSIAYLSRHLEQMKANTVAGYVITCAGDPGPFSYLSTRMGDAMIDKLTIHLLKNSRKKMKLYHYLERGSDERQYCAPGVDLPVGSLMRSKYGTFPEYHTSLDDLKFVTPKSMAESLGMFQMCIEAIEKNLTYTATTLGEPQLSKRNLYRSLSTREFEGEQTKIPRLLCDFLSYADGARDLLEIAELLKVPIQMLYPVVKVCLDEGLISTPSANEKRLIKIARMAG